MTKVCRIMSMVGIVLLLGISTPAAPLVSSIMPLTDETGLQRCTVFSINTFQHYWLTAGHCVADGEPRFIGIHATAIVTSYWGPDGDWAVLVSPAIARYLPLADGPPRVGQEVTIVGFVANIEGLLRVKTVLAGHNAQLVNGPNSDVFVSSGGPGHSGSPVLRKGRVVGLYWGRHYAVERGFAIPWETLHTHLGQYWESDE